VELVAGPKAAAELKSTDQNHLSNPLAMAICLISFCSYGLIVLVRWKQGVLGRGRYADLQNNQSRAIKVGRKRLTHQLRNAADSGSYLVEIESPGALLARVLSARSLGLD
jgi:hypothetical protein